MNAILSPERRRSLRKLGRDLLVALVLFAGDWLLAHGADYDIIPAGSPAAYPVAMLVWRELRAALGKPATVTES